MSLFAPPFGPRVVRAAIPCATLGAFGANRQGVLRPPWRQIAKNFFTGCGNRTWTRGAGAVREKLRREFYPSFMTFTTGRSAEPVPFFYSPHDIQNLHTTGSRLVDIMGLDPEYRIANVFPYAPHLAFWQVFFAGQAKVRP